MILKNYLSTAHINVCLTKYFLNSVFPLSDAYSVFWLHNHNLKKKKSVRWFKPTMIDYLKLDCVTAVWARGFKLGLLICLFFNSTAAKSLQSRPALCNSIDGSPPGSPVPGILQARTLEWVAISFSNACLEKGKSLSRVQLLATP